MYEIKIENEKGTSMTRKIRAPKQAITPDSEPKTAPDLSGFKDKNTYAYYVIYDESGNNERIGDRIEFDDNGEPTNIPTTGWYNYKNKIWANIATSNKELTQEEKANISKATSKNVAYWVWIPRYEYKIIDDSDEDNYIDGDGLYQFALINFIGTETTNPSAGYKIPESFTWDEQPISGYWVSKYEVSAAK